MILIGMFDSPFVRRVAITLKLLEKDRRKRFQDAHHLHEELKALQRSLPSTPFELQSPDAPDRPAGVTGPWCRVKNDVVLVRT